MAQRKRNPGAIRDLESIVDPVSGNITTTGSITAASMTATGNVLVGGNLTVCGDASIEGNLTVSGGITMAGQQIRHPVQFGPFSLTASSVSLVTDVPAWANRFDISVVDMSTGGGAPPIVQFGTLTGLVTAGYVGGLSRTADAAAIAGVNFANGFRLSVNHASTFVIHGHIVLQRHGTATSNTWEFNFVAGRTDIAASIQAGGHVVLPGPLTTVILKTTTGTATEAFDGGSAAGRYIY